MERIKDLLGGVADAMRGDDRDRLHSYRDRGLQSLQS